MRIFTLDYQHALIAKDELQEALAHLKSEQQKIAQARQHGYKTDYASLNLPFDADIVTQCEDLAQQKRSLDPHLLVVVGIGGSNLGAKAVYQAAQEIGHANELPVIWADTIDPDYVQQLLDKAKQILDNGFPILVTIISKSGTTTETAALAQIFIDLVKHYYPDEYSDHIVVITDNDSPLWNLAQSNKFSSLAIPKQVGGRYSVFSAAGLFPLAMLGIAIDQLVVGAKKILEDYANKTDDAAISAALIFLLKNKGKTIHDFFVWSPAWQKVGAWYRQLMGESIGKQYALDGSEIFNGITPTVSVGTTDLHSVGQLYLAGPRDKSTCFVSFDNLPSEPKVPQLNSFNHVIEHIQGKSLAQILHAIEQGVYDAYQQQGLPFMHVRIPEKNAYYLGQFMQYKMLEMIYLGYLCNINPFDQPQVELYKNVTRRILAHD